MKNGANNDLRRGLWALRALCCIVVAGAGVAATESECWVAKSEPCVRQGDECSTEIEGKLYKGTIQDDGDDVARCRQGRPGNLDCEESGTNQPCEYTCVVEINGMPTEHNQAKVIKMPVLSGGNC